ncbi:MAG: hilA 7, partial [Acidobacteria bacterium]|nr:hilA 7 [Acidobacteriota bacterium]
VFGEVMIDCERRQVTRAGEDVHLSAKAFAFLELLVRRRPDAVKRADIVDHVWPDTFVSPSNVPSLAQEIREALGDDARQPRFLRTIFGYGYAFIGNEEQRDAPAAHWLMIGSTRVDLTQRETILGRRTAALAADRAISRDHARIVAEDDRVTIEDLGSKNGTFVGGRRIAAATALVDGDVIVIGSASILFRAAPHAENTLTLPPAAAPTHP